MENLLLELEEELRYEEYAEALSKGDIDASHDEELFLALEAEYPNWPEMNDDELADAIEKAKPFHGYNKNRHARSGGLNAKFRAKYNRETGSNLKAPVTEKNPKGKRAGRRKSFCARMSGVKGPTSKDGKLTPKGAALKRWKCSMKKALADAVHEVFKKMTPEIRAEFLNNKNIQNYVVEKAKGRCWSGYEPTPGKKPYSEDSCRPVKKADDKKKLAQEHKRLVSVLESDSHKDDKKEAKIQRKELKQYVKAYKAKKACK
jgi:hypothetical protein